jgi:hypothetical protein
MDAIKNQQNKIPRVKITFQGETLTERYFNENPEIQALYPSKEKFMSALYLPLLEQQQRTDEILTLEISEHGIEINGGLQEKEQS